MLQGELRLLEGDAPNDRGPYYRVLQKCAMDAVPAPGELVNVQGNPYRVAKRQWAVPRDGSPLNDIISAYVYIYVLPWGS